MHPIKSVIVCIEIFRCKIPSKTSVAPIQLKVFFTNVTYLIKTTYIGRISHISVSYVCGIQYAPESGKSRKLPIFE